MPRSSVCASYSWTASWYNLHLYKGTNATAVPFKYFFFEIATFFKRVLNVVAGTKVLFEAIGTTKFLKLNVLQSPLFPFNTGTFVVNVGDPLEAWTKGLYRAGVHRVRSSPGKHRFSATFFYGPSYKCIIEPLDIDLTRNIDYSPELRRRKLPCTYGDYYITSFQNSLDWFKG